MERRAWGYLRRLEGRFIQIFSVRFTAVRCADWIPVGTSASNDASGPATPPPAYSGTRHSMRLLLLSGHRVVALAASEGEFDGVTEIGLGVTKSIFYITRMPPRASRRDLAAAHRRQSARRRARGGILVM